MHVCEGGGEAERERERIVILLTSMTGLEGLEHKRGGLRAV